MCLWRISVVCVSGMFLWGVSLRCVSEVILSKMSETCLWRDSLGCVTASMEMNTSAGCATLIVPLLATARATLLAASFASPLEVRKHARMAKPALRCASLTLNAATCELNSYGKAAEFLLVDAPLPPAEPHTQCHGCHPNLTNRVRCFAVLRLLCFTCLCFPLLCHT